MVEELSEGGLRFAPSRAEGWPDVSEVVIRPDRIEVVSAGERSIHRLEDLAEWSAVPRWIRPFYRLLRRTPAFLPVGERWFHGGASEYCCFNLFTHPPLKAWMPAGRPNEFPRTDFHRVQEILRDGGFATWDMT